MLGEGHPAPARARPNQSRAKRGTFRGPGVGLQRVHPGRHTRAPAEACSQLPGFLLLAVQSPAGPHVPLLPPPPASRRLRPGLVQSPQGLASASPRTVLLPTVPPFSPFVTETNYVYISLDNKT